MPPWIINIIKYEGAEDKTGPIQEEVPVGGGKALTERWRRVNMVDVFCITTVKLVEIVLRRWGGWERMMEGMNLIKIYYKQIYKCHNDSPRLLLYASKNKEKLKTKQKNKNI
jgi:hypothetical protein